MAVLGVLMHENVCWPIYLRLTGKAYSKCFPMLFMSWYHNNMVRQKEDMVVNKIFTRTNDLLHAMSLYLEKAQL